MDKNRQCGGFDPGNAFRKRIIEVFGKSTFAEEELTEDFYSELYVSCSEYFTVDGSINLDRFRSPQLREWFLHGDDCVELRLLAMLEMLPPDLSMIKDYLDSTTLSPPKLASTVIRFITEDCQFEGDQEKPPEQLHSTYLLNLIELLLDHGLDPNEAFEDYSVMDSLDLVDTGYVAADTMDLLLQKGGNLYQECDGETLFDRIEFNVIFDAINQENRDRYDQLIHLWLVMIGHGAKSLSSDGERKELVQFFKPPHYDAPCEQFTVGSFRNHRDFSWALTHVPGHGENWSLHIIDKSTGWEVLRL